MLTLYFSHWKPSQPLSHAVYQLNVSDEEDVNHLRELIARKIRADEGSLDLYRIPANTPLPLEYLKAAKISLSDLGEPLTISWSLASVFVPQPTVGLHLIVVNRDIPFSVHCWIRGSNPDNQIVLEIPRQHIVIQLLSAIQKNFAHLSGVPVEHLQLFKFSYSQQEDLCAIVKGPRRGTLLPNSQTLNTVFSDVPFVENACVVVEVVGLKDKRLQDWDVAERASKKLKVSPSSLCPSEYYAIQADTDARFIDGRVVRRVGTQSESSSDQPCPHDKQLPPFEALYTGFGEFLDTYRAERQSQVMGGTADLRHAVEIFAEEMAQVYKLEKSRQSCGLKPLNRMFFRSPRPVIVPSDIENTRTDGHYVYGDHNIGYLFVEFKNEDAGSKAIPAIQMAAYYQACVVAVARNSKELIYCSRLPAVGITIIGPVVTFYAMCWIGSVLIFPLTPGISCISSAGGGDDRRALHAAFFAALGLVNRIEKDMERLDSPAPRLSNHFYPDITRLPCLNSQGSIEFRITNIMHSGVGRILYRAKSIMPPDLDLVIKVTRSYSIDLHNFCASRGHAPAIHGFKKLPGNLTVIAMEHLEGDHLGSGEPQEFRNKMAQQLKRLVKAFHLDGYVHGDLRIPNIYRAEDKVKLLDFDWGGKVGKAFYPCQTLTSVLQQGRNMDNLMITKEDDERVLKISLESIGCS